MLGTEGDRKAQQRIEQAQIEGARELNLSVLKLRKLPKEIASLTQLQKLNLNNNQLTELPESIASLTQLQKLNLNNNRLTELPEAIASLTQLQLLDLYNNRLTELPEAIASLTQLQLLDLYNNQLRKLPKEIASLTQLHKLSLSNNQLTELPEAIASLTQLQTLYLRNNQLRELPESIASLTQLHTLDLENNQLRELPELIASLTQLQVVCLSNNPLNPDLAATYQQGTQAVLQYLRAKAEAKITLNEAKLIFIGEGEVGKSCLLGALREDEWLESRPTTHGIEIKPVIVTHPDTDTEISLNGWDFGGQPVYRPTHQLFFSAPAVYLVVWKPREGPQQGFVKEWITLIKHREPDAKVLVVATHGGPGQRQPDIDRQEIHDRFGSDTVLGFFHVNSKPDAQNFRLSELWSNPPFPGEAGYPKELHPIFLKLMERFDLSYRVVLDPTQPSNTSLIAQLVPDTRPELPNWGQQPEAGDRQQVQICRIVDDRGQAVRKEDLLYKLIVRLHKYSLGRCNYEKSIHWQRGLMLDDDYNGRALVEYIDTDVKITVRAAYPGTFLSSLMAEIKWLVKNEWKGLHPNMMVPCITPCGKNSPGNALFEVEKLIKSKKKSRDEHQCHIPGCDEWQNIDCLLNNAPTTQPPSQEIIHQFQNVRDDLNKVLREIGTLDIRAEERFQSLSQEQRVILSKGDEQFASLMQMSIDQAKDGPRLFSFKPIEPKFFDSPKWIKTKFQITLWCEHSRRPLPALNPHDKKKGVYELEVSREWFTKAAPYLKILTGTLSLVLPIANSATKLMLDEATYKGIEEGLDLGQKSIESTLKASDLATNLSDESDLPDWQHGEAPIMAKDSVLRKLHELLKAKDPGFGGLVRVQNRRREFLWVHEQFVDEY